MKTTMPWIAVSDKLPENEECVLIVVDGNVFAGFIDAGEWRYIEVDLWISDDEWRYVSADVVYTPVTHWMYFPDYQS